jgi:Ca2+-transporting ATPase
MGGPATTRTADRDERWYARPVGATATALDVDPAAGLSAEAVTTRLARGRNELPAEPVRPGWLRLLDEYRSYMQLILVGAALVSLLIQQWGTALLLVLLTVLNAVVGLRQQGKADSAMNALRSMVRPTARVRRDGAEATVPATGLVPGDVVLLTAGDQVPADGRIAAANALQIDESALTGESVPAAKGTAALPGGGRDLGPADQTTMAFMNTLVTHGSGTMLVTATGARTEVGRIAGGLGGTGRHVSPLTRQLNTLTLYIAGAAGLTMAVMFVLGRARGQAWDALFLTAVSLAIAAIPEALPTVTQTILSLGGLELAHRHAIVKDLPSVEALGFTSAINTDKTGTLTMNQVTAVEVAVPTGRYAVTGDGVARAAGDRDLAEEAVLPYLVASDAQLVGGEVVGDPTEGALQLLGQRAGLDVAGTRERWPRLATLPFDPAYKLMATFHRATGANGAPVVRCFVKGAAPAVTGRAGSALSGGADVPWDDRLARWAGDALHRMAAEGQKVMAAATVDLDPLTFDPAGDLLGLLTGLRVTSLVGLADPPRPESAAAVESARRAHIRVRMVTGDDVATGAAVARQVGIPGEAMLGADFAALSEQQRLERVPRLGVLGRVAPEHKVLLAETLRQGGDVVAMTGDGVNDAPAIRAADIGIAMGSGTEVAKNASRLVLSDDNFATIVYAVEQGRKIYDNLLKYVRFVLVLLVVFVLAFLGAALFDIAAGEPFTPAQVLWIHFVVNAPFGFALGFDRESPGLMTMWPRSRGEAVLTGRLAASVGLAGLVTSIGLLCLRQLGTDRWDEATGGSMAFTAFAFCLIVAALECRAVTGTVFTTATFDSRALNRALLGETVLALLVTQLDVLRRLLDTVRLDAAQLLWSLVPALVLLAVWEAGKAVARRRLRAGSLDTVR